MRVYGYKFMYKLVCFFNFFCLYFLCEFLFIGFFWEEIMNILKIVVFVVFMIFVVVVLFFFEILKVEGGFVVGLFVLVF